MLLYPALGWIPRSPETFSRFLKVSEWILILPDASGKFVFLAFASIRCETLALASRNPGSSRSDTGDIPTLDPDPSMFPSVPC